MTGPDDDGGLRWRGAKLVLTCGDSLLVMRRDDMPTINWPGMWDLPGGAREPGEGPRACALRELHEETGLRLDPARLTGGPQPLPHKPGSVGFYFQAEITAAEARSARLGDEGAELRLMPVTEFIAHPQAVPHFRGIVAAMLGL
ncbi:NUDIX hydrolase [Paracoccus sphaerophysae]|uniref:NUDIX hydrolase n=1 Tax=Paracoccus sphaerophysae TaxID=690417 RepID=UPI002356F1C6|nr:NUDIX hydrolase [Paracoccus sphaerophysae]